MFRGIFILFLVTSSVFAGDLVPSSDGCDYAPLAVKTGEFVPQVGDFDPELQTMAAELFGSGGLLNSPIYRSLLFRSIKSEIDSDGLWNGMKKALNLEHTRNLSSHTRNAILQDHFRKWDIDEAEGMRLANLFAEIDSNLDRRRLAMTVIDKTALLQYRAAQDYKPFLYGNVLGSLALITPIALALSPGSEFVTWMSPYFLLGAYPLGAAFGVLAAKLEMLLHRDMLRTVFDEELGLTAPKHLYSLTAPTKEPMALPAPRKTMKSEPLKIAGPTTADEDLQDRLTQYASRLHEISKGDAGKPNWKTLNHRLAKLLRFGRTPTRAEALTVLREELKEKVPLIQNGAREFRRTSEDLSLLHKELETRLRQLDAKLLPAARIAVTTGTQADANRVSDLQNTAAGLKASIRVTEALKHSASISEAALIDLLKSLEEVRLSLMTPEADGTIDLSRSTTPEMKGALVALRKTAKVLSK